MKTDYEIKSIKDAIRIIEELNCDNVFLGKIDKSSFPYGIFYRGQSNSEYSLTPSVFRNINLQGSSEYHSYALSEQEIFRNAQRKFRYSARESDRQLYELFDWLCVLQHYDIPTRLLDWTENIAVALYFAVSTDNTGRHCDKDAKLLILNARSLNSISGHEKSRNNLNTTDSFGVKLRTTMIISNTRESWRKLWVKDYDDIRWRDEQGGPLDESDFATPIAVLPNYLNQRMFLQSCLFTLHGGKLHNGLLDKKIDKSSLPLPISLEKINSEQIKMGKPPIIIEAIIPSIYKEKIARELSYLGIHPGTIRPELEYQASYFKRKLMT